VFFKAFPLISSLFFFSTVFSPLYFQLSDDVYFFSISPRSTSHRPPKSVYDLAPSFPSHVGFFYVDVPFPEAGSEAVPFPPRTTTSPYPSWHATRLLDIPGWHLPSFDSPLLPQFLFYLFSLILFNASCFISGCFRLFIACSGRIFLLSILRRSGISSWPLRLPILLEVSLSPCLLAPARSSSPKRGNKLVTSFQTQRLTEGRVFGPFFIASSTLCL